MIYGLQQETHPAKIQGTHTGVADEWQEVQAVKTDAKPEVKASGTSMSGRPAHNRNKDLPLRILAAQNVTIVTSQAY